MPGSQEGNGGLVDTLHLPNFQYWCSGDIQVLTPQGQPQYLITGNGKPLGEHQAQIVVRAANGAPMAIVSRAGTNFNGIPNAMTILLPMRRDQRYEVAVGKRIMPHRATGTPGCFFGTSENQLAWVYCSSGHKWRSARKSIKKDPNSFNPVSVLSLDECDIEFASGEVAAHVADSSNPERQPRHLEITYNAKEIPGELLLAFMCCKQMQYAGRDRTTIRGKMITAGAGAEMVSGGLIQTKFNQPSQRRSSGLPAATSCLGPTPGVIPSAVSYKPPNNQDQHLQYFDA